MIRHAPQIAARFLAWPGQIAGAVLRLALCLPVALTLDAGTARASVREESRRCDLAAARAAEATGVPIDLLLAITRAETGRSGAGRDPYPWPWTINAEGEGHWYETRDEAISAAEAHLAGGTASFDIGCFQLNVRWHGEGFATLEDMFDPQRNADYAAGFLLDLYRESSDWKQAVAAYHSRTPELAARYVRRVKSILEGPGADTQPTAEAMPPAAPRENRFPLLQAGGVGSAGSLVPSQAGTGPLFGGQS